MAGVLPTLASRGGAQCQYPVVRRVEFKTKIQRAQNASEQRWSSGGPLAAFVLTYTRIPAVDRNSLDAFIASQKGAFDSTWSIALGTQTYTNMTFASDSFPWSENPSGYFSSTVQCFQTISGGSIAAGGSNYFPSLASGAPCQMPFVRTREWHTTQNNMDSGLQYSFGHFGLGLTNYPTRDLRSFPLQYPSISETDAAMIEAHFIQFQGMAGQFHFVDPFDGFVYDKVRYGSDVLEFRYLQKGQVQVNVLLQETH